MLRRLSWDGHEFIASVRDAEVWSETKKAAKKGGTEALNFIWEIAKGVVRKQIKERAGIDL